MTIELFVAKRDMRCESVVEYRALREDVLRVVRVI